MKGNRVGPVSYIVRATQLAWQAFQEHRLPLSPRRWLIDLRHLRGVMAAEPPLDTQSPIATPANLQNLREAITRQARAELSAFLKSGASLTFPPEPAPLVSIVLVLFNRAELTLRCLRSLPHFLTSSLPHFLRSLELVLVDNASTDETSLLLDRIQNAVVIRHPANEGFSKGVNAGAAAATGKYLLLLNNDAELTPGCLEAGIARLEKSPDIGAVGGKLILPGGRLQEAGSIIWNDGSCLGYGRDDSPAAPAYAFTRDVDFCSAAFLLTPRDLFLQLGGFDLAFSPAYYEDADYCVRVWEAGRRVVYDPACVVRHFEFASSPAQHAALERQLEKRQTFVRKHAGWLAHRPNPGLALAGRSRSGHRGRVLVFDDRVPHRSIGSGFPRAVEIVEQITGLGFFVTLYPLSFPREDWASVYADIPPGVEVMIDYGAARVAEFMAERRGYYDAIVVSRHHNMQRLRERLGAPGTWGSRVVYDAEAVSALRDVEQKRAEGDPMTAPEEIRAVREEIELARGADAVLAVSDLEKDTFTRAGIPNVVVASHAVTILPAPRKFPDRSGFLFVGAFAMLSPNQDAVLWFAREVLPRVEEILGERVPFTVAGHNLPADIRALGRDGITLVEDAADLAPLYDRARVFVAPTRFAAGIPLKVIHAAAHGLPVIATSLLARQLGWADNVDLLAADAADDFARKCAALHSTEPLWECLRTNALKKIEAEYSPAVLRARLLEAIQPVAVVSQ